MLRLLQIEWLKFYKNKVVWVMLGMFAVLLPAKLSIGSSLENLPPPLPSSSIFTEFPTVWGYLGYNGSWQGFFFLGFLAIYIITSEYANKTAKQSIIQGMTRKEFFIGKISSIVLISALATIYFTIVGGLTGVAHTENWTFEMLLGHGYIIPRFFLMILSYCSFAFLIALLLRKTGLSLLMYFSYILFLEPVIRLIYNNYFPGRSHIFFPMNAAEDLCPLPLYELIPEFMQQNGKLVELLTPLEAISASSIYTIVFVAIAYFVFMKRDM